MRFIRITALALLLAGCTEQAVEKSFADPCLYCGKPYELVRCSEERDSANAIPDTIAGWSTVPIPKYLLNQWYGIIEPDSLTENCGQLRNFAAWCQKAYPEVWEEWRSNAN